MFRGPKTRWWMNVSAMMTTMGVTKDLEHFKEAVLDKYFPKCIKANKELEF